MKTFVINLEKDHERREKIVKQCVINKLKYELIHAVDGRTLSTEMLTLVTHDYPRCALTNGEIGCALSHLTIYARMVAEDVPYALVLEDDSVPGANLASHLAGIKKLISATRPEVFLLTGDNIYNCNIKSVDCHGNEYYRLAYGSGGYGYVINQAAAQEILKQNRPVIFEADRWMFFRNNGRLRVWCSKRAVITTSDVNRETSVLENGRKQQFAARSAYINRFKRTMRFYQARRIKDVLLNKTGLAKN
ncbi:glycosyl transferase family 25 [Pantoea alhagi]|uniref:glycosyltransferase family 25 protein n=1 Tax=Mixta sp. BE291 TaxID=3158787 RepID=UPI00286258F7|nr:glycosyl transferase family 25 [Pantoea alhagi]